VIASSNTCGSGPVTPKLQNALLYDAQPAEYTDFDRCIPRY
jgi:hypothetical protein